jgi:hypothetical protein
MDLPSSKLSWHKRPISGRSGSGPSLGATGSGSAVPTSSSKTVNKTIHQQVNGGGNSGAHTSARAEGETAPRVDGAGERVVRGERKTGRRWARRRFAAGGPVLGPRGGALARAGAGDPRGRLDLARGGREGAVRGEVAELRDGDRRR